MELQNKVVKSDNEQQAPDCTCCGLPTHGHKPPKAYKKRRPIGCVGGPVQLEVERKTKLRATLRKLIFESELPKAALAEKILGMNAATLHRTLAGVSSIAAATEDQLRAIRYIERKGAHVHVVYEVGKPGQGWEVALKKRRRSVLRVQHQMQHET